MRRELEVLKRNLSSCCPGHDDYPCDSYNNRRSKKARAKGKRQEHKFVRTLVARQIRKEVLLSKEKHQFFE